MTPAAVRASLAHFAAAVAALAIAGLILAGAPAMAGFASASGAGTGRPARAASAHHKKAPAKHMPAKHPAAKRQLPLKMMWGPLTLPNGASAFPTYHSLGVQVLETQLVWARTALTRPNEPANPADPAYHWPPELEQMITQAAQYGIAVAVLVKGSPAWANGGQDESWAPTNAEDYASFLQAASRRYPTVHFWMIWGESNGEDFYPMPANSPVGPRRYALLLEAAYGALKAVSSSNLVIGGMTFTSGLVKPREFLRWMRLPDGSPPRMDYYGHNPYSTRFPEPGSGPPPSAGCLEDLRDGAYRRKGFKCSRTGERDIDSLGTLHSELATVYRHRHGGAPKLWLSEWSISSDGPNYAFNYFVSRPVQAHWVTAAFKLVDSLSYVAGLGWYDLQDEPTSVPEHLTEGLLTETGEHKPAFSAYAHAP
jgi:hypothetical protein